MHTQFTFETSEYIPSEDKERNRRIILKCTLQEWAVNIFNYTEGPVQGQMHDGL